MKNAYFKIFWLSLSSFFPTKNYARHDQERLIYYLCKPLLPQNTISTEHTSFVELQKEEIAKKWLLRTFSVHKTQGASVTLLRPFNETPDSYWGVEFLLGGQFIDAYGNGTLAYRRLYQGRYTREIPFLWGMGGIIEVSRFPKFHLLLEGQCSRFRMSYSLPLFKMLFSLGQVPISPILFLPRISNIQKVLSYLIESSNVSTMFVLKKNLCGFFMRYGAWQQLNRPAPYLWDDPNTDYRSEVVSNHEGEPEVMTFGKIFSKGFEMLSFFNNLLNSRILKHRPEMGFRFRLFSGFSIELSTLSWKISYQASWNEDPELYESAQKSFRGYTSFNQGTILPSLFSENIFPNNPAYQRYVNSKWGCGSDIAKSLIKMLFFACELDRSHNYIQISSNSCYVALE